MPNNTENILRITGPEADLAAFEAFNRGRSPRYVLSDMERKYVPYPEDDPEDCLTFSSILPVPPAVLAQAFDPAGYDWQCANWGTKWDAYGPPQSCRLGNALLYTFTTAWRAPKPWLRAAALRFTTLTFELFSRDEYPWCLTIEALHDEDGLRREECYGGMVEQ